MGDMTWCDRCGECANAVVEWWKPEGWARLLMCGHHSREHNDALRLRGFIADAPADMWGIDSLMEVPA